MTRVPFARLEKRLTLFDVYVVSTGTMISAGLFLLPGIAASYTGPSVILAYLLSGLLIVPAMLSQAELATAMPRAGGAYYYLDRTLGPLVGTIGGVGTWFALVLKAAFALIGMGAYIALVVDVPVKSTALAFTAFFAALNVVGARESSRLLRALLFVLLAAMAFFIVLGLVDVGAQADTVSHVRLRLTPFLLDGVDGLIGTIGIVFVSYVGLTNVASLAEEVVDPERNIPLGMMFALGTALVVYVLAVFVMVTSLGADRMSGSLTPIADAAAVFTAWMPGRLGVWVMAVAAVVAFAAMANAGILSASRYPLAMARDRVFPDRFAGLSGRGQPVLSILLTCALLAAFLLTLNVEGVAKLASALQLMLFGLLNVSVIVMRESRIESYDPGFRSPLYPWMQLAGLIVPFILVAEMGWLTVLFTLAVAVGSVAWYNYYARPRIEREGAIFHVFERLGRRRFAGLDRELRDIMKEKGARAEDPFDHVVAHSDVIDCAVSQEIHHLIEEASGLLARRLPVTAEALVAGFERGLAAGGTPVSHGAALVHTRLPTVDDSELVIVRCGAGVHVSETETDAEFARQAAAQPIRAVFFLVSGEADPGQHLRILAQIAGRVDDQGFMPEWLANEDEQDLKETLLRDDRFLSLQVRSGARSEVLIGKALCELQMPEGALVALIRRRGVSIVPRGQTVLMDNDRLTIIGEPAGVVQLAERYGEPR